MAETPIKDENLRLVLSKGHEGYLLARIRERNIANGAILSVWVLLFALPFWRVEEWDWLVVVWGFVTFSAPFGALIVGRNLWMARKYWNHYQEHGDFLKKYRRAPTPEIASVRRTWRFSVIFGFIAMCILLVITGSIVFGVFSKNQWNSDRNSIEDARQVDICRLVSYGNPDAVAEAKRRELTENQCNEILSR